MLFFDSKDVGWAGILPVFEASLLFRGRNCKVMNFGRIQNLQTAVVQNFCGVLALKKLGVY